jgi:Acyl-CoA thioester hydrolase/BAAT N-terminal region
MVATTRRRLTARLRLMSQGGWRRRWAAPGAALSLMMPSAGLAGRGSDKDAHTAVRVTPAATLLLSATDANGYAWAAHAEFRANSHGTIDVDDSPALSGSYKGVLAVGLISDMQPAAVRRDEAFSWSLNRPSRFTLTVQVGTKMVARTSFQRVGASPGVRVTHESIRSAGFYGDMWRPGGGETSQHAAVLEFGGSEGGLSGGPVGGALASAGYPPSILRASRSRASRRHSRTSRCPTSPRPSGGWRSSQA